MLTLELERLGRRFGRRWVLRGINLSIEEGEMVAVWGGCGAGKSTLLHLLATLLRPSEGRVAVDGFDLRTHPARVRSSIGIALQTPALDPGLTLFDALHLRAAMQGVPKAQRTARIFELLPLLEIEDLSDAPVALLSSTERRRAELVAALLETPRVLLLDEPFDGMIGETTRRVWEYLYATRAQTRMTLLLTTSRAEMAAQCHRIAVLSAGRLMACDTPDMIRGAAGKDVVTVQPLDERLTARRLHERLQVTVQEEESGFKIEVERGDRVAADLMGSFAGQTSAIYVRRPTLEAGLQRIADGKADPAVEP